MPLRYCENPGCCRIFCDHLEDVGEVVLRKDVVAVESFGRTSGVQAFLMTMRSWDLASCMCVEGGVQGGTVEVLADEGLLGTRMLQEEALPMVYGCTVLSVMVSCVDIVEMVFAEWLWMLSCMRRA